MEWNLNILLLRSQLSKSGLTQGQEGNACSCFPLPWRSVIHNGFIFVYDVSRRPGIIFHVDIESPQFWSPKETTLPQLNCPDSLVKNQLIIIQMKAHFGLSWVPFIAVPAGSRRPHCGHCSVEYVLVSGVINFVLFHCVMFCHQNHIKANKLGTLDSSPPACDRSFREHPVLQGRRWISSFYLYYKIFLFICRCHAHDRASVEVRGQLPGGGSLLTSAIWDLGSRCLYPWAIIASCPAFSYLGTDDWKA